MAVGLMGIYKTKRPMGPRCHIWPIEQHRQIALSLCGSIGYRLLAIGYARSLLLTVGYSHEARYPPYTPPACTKHEWNIKNHAKLASVRIAIRPSPKILSVEFPPAHRFGSEVHGSLDCPS